MTSCQCATLPTRLVCPNRPSTGSRRPSMLRREPPVRRTNTRGTPVPGTVPDFRKPGTDPKSWDTFSTPSGTVNSESDQRDSYTVPVSHALGVGTVGHLKRERPEQHLQKTVCQHLTVRGHHDVYWWHHPAGGF